MTGHLLVLVQGRHGVAATLLGAGCAIGYVWFAPRGRLLELNHNWWQVAVCVSYVVVGLTFLCFFAAGRPRSERGRSAP